jgi:hypothetical protein
MHCTVIILVRLLIYLLQAYICLGDAFLSMDQFDSAENSYLTCLEIDPLIRRSKSFKVAFYLMQDLIFITR